MLKERIKSQLSVLRRKQFLCSFLFPSPFSLSSDINKQYWERQSEREVKSAAKEPVSSSLPVSISPTSPFNSLSLYTTIFCRHIQY